MKEVWRDIKGYEGIYQVSNLGNVRSLDRMYEYHNSSGEVYFREYKGKVLTQNNSLRYKQISLSNRGSTGNFLVHRLVAEAFIPNPDNLPEVNHKDENPSNNRVDNLEWCTKSYNINYGNRNKLVSKALKGRILSPESIEKLRNSLKGHTPWNKGLHTRHIVCLDANIRFDCCEDAAKWIGGVTPEAVEYAARHSACCKGHVFVYADNIPEDIQSYVDRCLEKYRSGRKSGRPCKCIEDDLVFSSITEAARHYNCKRGDVSNKLIAGKGIELSDGRIIHFERISHEEFEKSLCKCVCDTSRNPTL